MKKSPSLRFVGHTDDWEQRKLRDFGKATGGTSIESEFSEDGKYKVISIGSYSEDSIYRDQGIRAVESEKTKNRVLNEGDLTMILNDKTASGNIIGRALLIEKSGVYVYNQRTERIEVDHEKFNSLFIYEMLNAPNVRDKIIKQSQGNTQIYVNWSTIAETDYLVPQIEEQRYLGEFFYNLDNLITLHQRKYEVLTRIKKSMMERMFPRDGKCLPEIRFPGFTDTWEQRKLLECIQKITDFRGRTPKKLGMDWSEEGYLALSALNVKDGYIDFNQDVHYGNQELYDKWMTGNELHKGQVLFTTEAPMGNVAQVPDNRRYILSQRTIAFDVKDNLITENFLATVLRTPTVFADLTALSSGGTAKGVSQKSLASVEIRLPKDLKEQEKIADTFSNLDNLITLHQRKYELMQKYKKGLLQRMFI